MDSTTVKVISVSISVGVATLFLYKIFRARIQNGKRNEKTLKRSMCGTDHFVISEDSITEGSVVLKCTDSQKVCQVYEVKYNPSLLITKDCKCTITGLKPSTDYEFKVLHIDSDRNLWPCKETPIFITTLKSAAEDIGEKSDEINQRRKLVWEHPSESIYSGKFGKIVKKEYGKSRNDDNTEEKTILIYGPDESHTNAVIDGIMNFICGVSDEDDYRFSLVNTSSKGQMMDQENDEKTSVTILKVFPTDKSRILYTLNIVGVNSTIAIENVDILSTDLESHEITSLNSFCFVMKDLIPLTCGKNLAKFVNVFNTCVDNAQGFHDPKSIFSIPFHNSGMSSNVDGTYPRQINVCLSRYKQNSFVTVFEEMEQSIKQPVNNVLNVHLLQRKIDENIQKLEKTKAKVTSYKEKIEKKIENIQEDKVFFQVQSQHSCNSNCKYAKYENAYTLQTGSNTIRSLLCKCTQICHMNCGVNEKELQKCNKFKETEQQRKERNERKESIVCSKCNCSVEKHKLGNISKFANEIKFFNEVTESAKTLEGIIKNDFNDLKKQKTISNPKDGFDLSVIVVEFGDHTNLELEDSRQIFLLRSNEELITDKELD